MAQISAKRLILELLSASPAQTLDVSQLATGAGVFGITDNSVRVTLSRLVAAGLLTMHGRGSYTLAGEARDVQRFVAVWRTRLDEIVPWQGSWLAILTTALPKTERSAWRRLTTILRLGGFREFRPGLYLRPDNLRDGLSQALAAVEDFGLGIMRVADFAGEAPDVEALWACRALASEYRTRLLALERARRQIAKATPTSGAQIAFSVGAAAIRTIVRDPLLPDTLVDAEARRQLVDDMLAFDRLGRSLWDNVMGIERKLAA